MSNPYSLIKLSVTRIAKGLHIEEVMHVKTIGVRDDVYEGEKKKSLIWKPRGRNWLASRLWWLITKEAKDGTQNHSG